MNHIESKTGYQPKIEQPTERISRNLRQAIKVINADYQPIDWEDQAFLNHVLNDAISTLEGKEGSRNGNC